MSYPTAHRRRALARPASFLTGLAGVACVAGAAVVAAGVGGAVPGSAAAVPAGLSSCEDLIAAAAAPGTSSVRLDADLSCATKIVLAGGSDLTLDLAGHTLTASRGIIDTDATLRIEATGGGTLDASNPGGAAIGGDTSYERGTPSSGTPAGTLIINGGTVTAAGGHRHPGIGGGWGKDGGSVTINGGVVTATGLSGIGGGGTPYGPVGAGTITVNGGSVTATATASDGVGIGDAGGSVTISGGTVVARGGFQAPGIGRGPGFGSSGPITIGPDATVTAASENPDVSPVGRYSVARPEDVGGAVTNAGVLILASRVDTRIAPITNTATGTIWLDAPMLGSSPLVNDGSLVLTPDGSVDPTTPVTRNHFRVTYDVSAVKGASRPAPQAMFASRFAWSGLTLPPTGAGRVWATSRKNGTVITDASDFPSRFGRSSTGATEVTLYLVKQKG